MDLEKIIGTLAAIFTTISFLPQAIKTIQSKNTKGLSLGMYICFTIGVFFWLVYGILISDFPVIVANSITLVFALSILAMKLIYK